MVFGNVNFSLTLKGENRRKRKHKDDGSPSIYTNGEHLGLGLLCISWIHISWLWIPCISPKEFEGMPLSCQQRIPDCSLNIKGTLGSLSLPGFTNISTLHSVANLHRKMTVESPLKGCGYKFLHEIFIRWSLPFCSPVPVVTRTLHMILISHHPVLWWFIHVSLPLLGFRNMEGRSQSHIMDAFWQVT